MEPRQIPTEGLFAFRLDPPQNNPREGNNILDESDPSSVSLPREGECSPRDLYQVLRFNAHVFVRLLDQLTALEYQAQVIVQASAGPDGRARVLQKLQSIIGRTTKVCVSMRLDCSRVQAERITKRWKEGCTIEELRQHIRELGQRVRDELGERVFFCIDPVNLAYFERDEKGRLELRSLESIFGESVINRFGLSIGEDLFEAVQCYVYMRRAACVFHLMRAVEIAVPKLAKLCSIKDPKPSWGTVLTQAEKLTQKTEYKDLPEQLKPHIEFLRSIVADMRSMQRAWRNKVSHTEERLVLVAPDFHPQVVYDVMVATSSFLRDLADGLPEWCWKRDKPMKMRTALVLAHNMLGHCDQSGFSLEDQITAAKLVQIILVRSQNGHGQANVSAPCAPSPLQNTADNEQHRAESLEQSRSPRS